MSADSKGGHFRTVNRLLNRTIIVLFIACFAISTGKSILARNEEAHRPSPSVPASKASGAISSTCYEYEKAYRYMRYCVPPQWDDSDPYVQCPPGPAPALVGSPPKSFEMAKLLRERFENKLTSLGCRKGKSDEEASADPQAEPVDERPSQEVFGDLLNRSADKDADDDGN